MKRIVWFVIAVLGVSACSELSSAPDGGRRLTPGQRAADLLTCRSGYVVAYRADGTAYCASDSTTTTSTTTTTTTTSTSTSSTPQ